jgi:hypothetical protein
MCVIVANIMERCSLFLPPEFCVVCVLTGYHCSTTVQSHLSVASKYDGVDAMA